MIDRSADQESKAGMATPAPSKADQHHQAVAHSDNDDYLDYLDIPMINRGWGTTGRHDEKLLSLWSRLRRWVGL